MIPKDKIIVDCSGPDGKSLAEAMSRAEPGDQITFGRVTGTLDEYQNNIAVFSIDEIEIKGGGAEKETESEAATTPDEETAEPAASVKLFKNAK